ncbi:MAG: hypothetical protein CVU56_21050 [Deltaproteobacteria bacterium HGW-Deltaproteobacteria-14]|jgi:nucleotide-binding universal stress UspA family protein|nr:MAG: hypothetical protein CVU56_21050 [Deltaproteobacteria bacterium HGW-Deltaproteobacteria-14]
MNAASILFATDLSGPARQCHALTAALVEALGAHLTILHVDDVAADQLDRVTELHAYLDMLSSFRRLRVEQLDADFAKLGVASRFIIERGKPERIIDTYSREHDVGLIIMGQHSHPGPLKKLLGSTTQRVIHLTDLPLLVVPIDDDAPDAPPPATLPRFRTILVPTALTDACGRALRAAVDVAKRLGAQVHATHALGLPSFVPIAAGEGYAAAMTSPLAQRDAHYRESLRAHVEREARGADVTSSLAVADTALAGILADAKEVGADLIMVPSTGKGAVARFFLGSVTEALAKHAPIPVMVLPPKYLEAW